MTIDEIILLRLYNQQISHHVSNTPEEVVAWMGAIQAQDYAGAKWSLGLRLPNGTETDIDKAIAQKAIVRTWPMRGTLHFVAADDVRWMLKLLTPRIIAGSAGRNRQLELDEMIFNKSHDLLISAMEGGKQLMRSEVYAILENAGITTTRQRGISLTILRRSKFFVTVCTMKSNRHMPCWMNGFLFPKAWKGKRLWQS